MTDKSDTEDDSEVAKNIKLFQNSIDEGSTGDALEKEQNLHEQNDEDNNAQQGHDQVELEQRGETEDSPLNEFTQNKKPRIDDKQFCQNNSLERMKKRKETQDNFRHVQTPKRGKITEATIGLAQVYGSIA
eukprot:16435708-Heterocapsa_arctica.AAC.1